MEPPLCFLLALPFLAFGIQQVERRESFFSLRTVRQNVRNSESFSRGGELKALPGVGSPPSSYLLEKETRHDKKKRSVVFPLSRR